MVDTELSEVTAFRGASGEVVRGFIHPGTLLTLLPVLLVMVLLGFIAGLLMKVLSFSIPLAVLTVLVLSSPVVGRFAMAARDGELSAGFLSGRLERGAVLGFVLRHAVLVLLWGLPLGLTGSFIVDRAQKDPFGSFATSSSLLLILAAIGLLGQSFSLLVATRTNSVREALSAENLSWLWSRRSDLAPFFASLLGGAFLFTAMVWPFLGGLALMLASSHPSAAVVLGVMTYAAPGLAAPVLLGRLCGAFIFGESVMSEPAHAPAPTLGTVAKGAKLAAALPQPDSPRELTPAPRTPGVAAAPLATMPGNTSAAHAVRRIPVDQALGQLRLKAASDPAGAVNDARILREAHPANPLVAAEWARMLGQSGQVAESLVAAVAAIKTALAAGTGPVALDIFRMFGKARDRLEFEPATLDALGRTLLQRNQIDDALWCFVTLSRKGGDEARIGKGLIGVAEAAARLGRADKAREIYTMFLDTYPGSTFRAYVEDAVSRLP